VLAIDRTEFRRLMSSKPALADIIFGSLVARREFLRAAKAARAVRIIGSRHSRDAMALRSFATRAQLGTRGSTSTTPMTSTPCWTAWGSDP